MNRINAGTPGPVAHAGDTIPHRFACRIARQFIVRAAVRGYLDWPTALRVLRKLEEGGVMSTTAISLKTRGDQLGTATGAHLRARTAGVCKPATTPQTIHIHPEV